MQVECKVVHPVSGKRHFQNQSQMKWPQLAEEAQDFCHTRLAQVICALGIKPASTKPPSKAASNLPRVAFAPSFPYQRCLFALSSHKAAAVCRANVAAAKELIHRITEDLPCQQLSDCCSR